MRTLVTGFGAFGAAQDNPSARLAASCGRPFRVLEVAWEAVGEFLDALDPASFDALLMLGVAVGRDHVAPELFARNHRSDHPDVRGVSLPGPVEEGGPLLLEATLWTPTLLAALEVRDDLRTSLDAGGYLCNDLSYRALRRFPDRRVGFLHVTTFGEIPEARQAAILQDVLAAVESA